MSDEHVVDEGDAITIMAKTVSEGAADAVARIQAALTEVADTHPDEADVIAAALDDLLIEVATVTRKETLDSAGRQLSGQAIDLEIRE